MGGSTWEGHAPLKAALDGLATAKGVSANRVKAVAAAAFQYAKDYKRVVHDVEIFLWKAEVEHRLAGLYAMDAIMRQSQAKLGSKDLFVKRFLQHMTNTITAVKKIPAEQQESVRHVIEEWQTRGYYTADDIEKAGGCEYSLNNSHARRPSAPSGDAASATRASPTHSDAASKQKLASLLSIIKKQKELKEQQSEQPQAPLLPQPALLPTPSGHRSRLQESPHHAPPPRHSLEDRQHGRPSDGYSRDQGTLSRGRGGHHDRDRSRSRSRDRDRGAPSSRDHSRDRSRGHDTSAGSHDRRPLSPVQTRDRRDSGTDRRESLDDSRGAKKPRSSRWGPPRPSDSGGGEDNRPPAIDTRDHERSTRFESRSPRNRYDGQLSDAGPTSGHGAWPPTGCQGPPPPPLRSGPPPFNSFPPGNLPGAGTGVLPPPRGGPPPYVSLSSTNNYTGGPPGPPGPTGGYPRSSDPSQGPPPHGGTPEQYGDPSSTGPSGEVCRKFLAGRCTFGDRCWHVHNQHQNGASHEGGPPPRGPYTHTEMNQARRKTVLCANFPQGNCRFGDRCSFAHGEDDLDKSAMTMRRPPPLSQDPMRGGPSPRGASPQGMFQQNSRPSPAASPHQPHPSTAVPAYAQSPARLTAPPRPLYGAGLPATTTPTLGAPHQPVGATSQWTGAAVASGYGGYATSPASQAPAPTGSITPVTSAPVSAVPHDRAPSRDDDEVDAAAAPEFTLQYDEDD